MVVGSKLSPVARAPPPPARGCAPRSSAAACRRLRHRSRPASPPASAKRGQQPRVRPAASAAPTSAGAACAPAGARAPPPSGKRQREGRRSRPRGDLEAAAPCAAPARARSRARGPIPMPSRWCGSVRTPPRGLAAECRARRRSTSSSAALRGAGLAPAVRGDRDARSLGRVDERVVDQDAHDLGHALRVADRLDVGRRLARRRRRSRSPCAPPPRRTRPPPGWRACCSGTGSSSRSIEPASRRDRSSRSVVSFWRRSTCSRIVARNSRGSSSSRSSSCEQLDEPAQREDRRAQLVRGVGDELLAGACRGARAGAASR